MSTDTTDSTAKLVEASAKVVEASAKLVEQVGTIVDRTLGRTPEEKAVSVAATSGSDSPGWLEANLVSSGNTVEQARVKVVDASGKFYHDNQVDPQTAPKIQARPDDFQRVYRFFFSKEEMLQYEGLKRFQRAFKLFEPTVLGRRYGDLSAADKARFPLVPHDDSTNPASVGTHKECDDAWTIPQAIGRLMASFNIDPGTGAVAGRDVELNPPWIMELTHAQCVIFHHVLSTQEDVQLVSPYSGQIW